MSRKHSYIYSDEFAFWFFRAGTGVIIWAIFEALTIVYRFLRYGNYAPRTAADYTGHFKTSWLGLQDIVNEVLDWPIAATLLLAGLLIMATPTFWEHRGKPKTDD